MSLSLVALDSRLLAHTAWRASSEQKERLNVGSWYLMLIDLGAHGFVVFLGTLSSVRTLHTASRTTHAVLQTLTLVARHAIHTLTLCRK
jgi:hypothetical protein